GAAGAAFVARAADTPDVLCFDMGGTSCDVCVVDDGAVQERSAGEIADRPLALPMLAVHTVGAGGGSIAWRDRGGALRVGPRSAGADPGPASYGRGGTEPTVTDANLVLGYLSPDAPLGSDVMLDRDAALFARAIADTVGELGERTRQALREPEAELRAIYELRYRGQSFELPIAAGTRAEPNELREAFEREHEARYGYRDEKQALELVTI